MKTHVTAVFRCSLPRAFKSPFLCDITKVHTGFAWVPRVTHCTDDQNWGQPGASKCVHTAPSLLHRGGFSFVDRVVARDENRYWKIEICDFQFWMVGFSRLEGEWRVTELEQDNIRIDYTYTLFSQNRWLYPLQWVFTKTIWNRYMQHVMENIRYLTLTKEPYQYT